MFVSRGIAIFIWLCQCPVFREKVKNFFTDKICKAKRRKSGFNFKGQNLKELVDTYENSNTFLFSSLNTEFVCVILKGINVVLREINLGSNKQSELDRKDFEAIHVANLKSIEVLNRAYFEKVKSKELRRYQNQRNLKSQNADYTYDNQESESTQRNESAVESEFISNKIKQEHIQIKAKVHSFAPKVFRFIRAIDNIPEYEIMKSVNPTYNKMQIFKSNQSKDGSGGSSGSFFFFTEDK